MVRLRRAAGAAGSLALAEHFSFAGVNERARQVADWVRDADRRFRSRIRDQESDFLRVVFDVRECPGQVLAFAFHDLLRVPGEYLPWLSRIHLLSLAVVFGRVYAWDRSPSRRLPPKRLELAMRSFRAELARKSRRQATFQSFLPELTRRDKAAKLMEWSGAMRVRVVGRLRSKGATLIYASVCAGL
jgi:hypothetical protein